GAHDVLLIIILSHRSLFIVFYISFFFFIFFFNDTATTEIYTLSLHDALPISTDHDDRRGGPARVSSGPRRDRRSGRDAAGAPISDRKSTRLNSSHLVISYAVFCLKKKKNKKKQQIHYYVIYQKSVIILSHCYI